ncbi:MAG: GGDEF domain-containing protein [Pseudomonadota bacterium]
MDTKEPGIQSTDEGTEKSARRITIHNAIPVDLVGAFAGDRAMSPIECAHVDGRKKVRGEAFYSDLLYAISHHYFVPERAEELWNSVLVHKREMSSQLGRNVSIAVAMLDHLSNITGEMQSVTLISEARVAEMVNLSMRDGMTGLFNHTSFYELLELEIRHRRRSGFGLALILVDVDDFKSVNDQGGHPEGDRVLVALSEMLVEETRESDICCRFGGEEFAVILPFTSNPRDVLEIAERIRIGASRITSEGRQVFVGIGVASCSGEDQTSHDLVEEADRALYEAKRTGKNRVVVADITA